MNGAIWFDFDKIMFDTTLLNATHPSHDGNAIIGISTLDRHSSIVYIVNLLIGLRTPRAPVGAANMRQEVI